MRDNQGGRNAASQRKRRKAIGQIAQWLASTTRTGLSKAELRAICEAAVTSRKV